jgi:3-hydroxyisobutyrate dehydrogenase-like beta-hydroxyacid dehydrogenase
MTTASTSGVLPLQDGVAVVGLGKMGLPMARNLRHKGFRVVGYDVSESSRQRAASIGIEVATTAKEAALDTALSLVVVGFDDQVTEVISGTNSSLLAGARAGHVIGVCSTVEPRTVVQAAETARGTSVHVVDAPLCRGEPSAEDGSLLVMLGGDAHVLTAIEPALAAVATDLYRLGGVGAGQVGKMLNNFLLWTSVVANREAMQLGGRLDVDLEALRQALMLSSGNNWALETWTRSRPMPWAEKDMRILMQHADDVLLAMPAAGLVREEIKALKILKNAWTEGGGATSSMDSFVRAHP